MARTVERSPLPVMQSTWAGPLLYRVAGRWCFIRDDGACYFLERVWVDGARFAYIGANVKGFLAFCLVRVLGLGCLDDWRMRLLPSAVDWAFRTDYGRCSSLAHFINADLYRREREAEAKSA